MSFINTEHLLTTIHISKQKWDHRLQKSLFFRSTTEMHRRTGYHVEDIYAAFKNWPVEGILEDRMLYKHWIQTCLQGRKKQQIGEKWREKIQRECSMRGGSKTVHHWSGNRILCYENEQCAWRQSVYFKKGATTTTTIIRTKPPCLLSQM